MLVVKHKEFTQLIEDDNEFQKQEPWLAESQDAFMSLEFQAKLCLEGTEDLEKEFQDEESRSTDIESSIRNLSSSALSKSSNQRSNEIAGNNLVTMENSSRNDAQVVKPFLLQLSKESWKRPQAVYLQLTKEVNRERKRYTVQPIPPSPLTQEACNQC